MRWGLALGAAATLGAAALIGTQWAGSPTAAPTAAGTDILAQGRKQLADADGMAFAAAFGTGMLASVTSSLPDLDPVGERTMEDTSEMPASAEGPAGQRSSKTRVSVTGSGSRITLVTEVEIHEVRGGSRLNGRVRTTVSLDYCPDKDGKVVADIDYLASGDTGVANAAGSAGASTSLSAKGRATGSVNDQALLASIDQVFNVEHSTRSGQNPKDPGAADGASRQDVRGAYVLSSSDPMANTPVPGEPRMSLQQGAGGTVRAEVSRSDDSKATSASLGLLRVGLDHAITAIFDKAQAKWRSGACLEIVVRPPVQAGGKTNTTTPKERKTFEVAVRHKTEQTELPLPLDATFDGRDTLEPKHVDKAPGRFDYTAGADPKDYGNVALKSVSRRGIAQERVAFDNQQRLGGPFSARTSGPMQALAEGQVSWQAKPGAPDEFIPSGSVRVSGTRRKCTVRGEADLAEGDGELHVKRDAAGKPIEYRGHGIKMMPLHFTCAGVSATQSMPVAWFGTAEAFRTIGGDGVLEGSLDHGDIHWTWRFTR